jgi:hypothetical protein
MKGGIEEDDAVRELFLPDQIFNFFLEYSAADK